MHSTSTYVVSFFDIAALVRFSQYAHIEPYATRVHAGFMRRGMLNENAGGGWLLGCTIAKIETHVGRIAHNVRSKMLTRSCR